jgi:hypothetical protein
MGTIMLRSFFALALLAAPLFGSFAALAAGSHALPRAADLTEAMPGRIVPLVAVSW